MSQPRSQAGWGGTPAPSPLLRQPDADACTHYISRGLWADKTIFHLLKERAVLRGDADLIVDRDRRISYAEAVDLSERLAAGLHAVGIGLGDAVSVQLPNWWQFPIIEYALARLGAVCNPLPPIYRSRELRFMLRLVQPKAVICPCLFRGFDHTAMMRSLAADWPAHPPIFVVGENVPADMRAFDQLLDPSLPPAPPVSVDPQSLAEIAFTSGTTGEPKGAMHTHNTNLSPVLSLVRRQRLNDSDVVLMPSTFGHQTGYVYGGQLPVVIGGRLVLMERWEAAQALELIEREGVTWIMGATPFLQDLCDEVRRAGPEKAGSLRIFLCSGAPIPRALLTEAHELLGCTVVSGWGMTEVGLVTLSGLDDSAERVAGTDGCTFDDSQICVIGNDGREVPRGKEGDLVTRGPSMFCGYFRRPETTAGSFVGDGWLRTGDRARIDEAGYVRITGRSKDLIIRGGENIPAVEVEELLHRHEAVRQATVIGVPDPRLQERACAVVVLHEGASFDFAEMRAHLERTGLARQYFPEFLQLVEELPMTPSGKVQKFVLRERMSALCAPKPAGEHA